MNAGKTPTIAPASPQEVLLLLFAVNIFSVMDRTIFSICAPHIADDLNLSDTQIGLLSGILFSAFYALFGIPLARIADRGSRSRLIALSLAVWSAITIATGAAQNFMQLTLARVGVAIGEAGATPASHAILTERFSASARPLVMAVHSAGAPVGAALGLSLGGFISTELDWRWAFVMLGAPGSLLALLVWLRLRKNEAVPLTGQQDSNVYRDLKELFQSRPYIWLLAGFATGAFVVNGLIQWFPAYFVRAYGATTSEVGAAFGLAYGLGAFSGMIFGGLVGSRLVARDRRWAMWVASLSYIIAAPLGAAALITQDITSAYLCTFLMSAAATAAYGPAFAMVQELAPARLRALASATAIMFATLIGAGLGPVAVGSLSDLSGGGAAGLRLAMLAVLAIAPATALCYLVSARKMGAPNTN